MSLRKNDIADEIAKRLGLPLIGETSGSTNRAAPLREAVRRFSIDLPRERSKPAMAEAIAEEAGLAWEPSHDSRRTPSGGGGNIAVEGWLVVLEAVDVLLEREK